MNGEWEEVKMVDWEHRSQESTDLEMEAFYPPLTGCQVQVQSVWCLSVPQVHHPCRKDETPLCVCVCVCVCTIGLLLYLQRGPRQSMHTPCLETWVL